MPPKRITQAQLTKATKGDSREKIVADICYLIGYVEWDDEDAPLKFLLQNYTTMDIAIIRSELEAMSNEQRRQTAHS